MTATIEARFWALVHPEPMSGCWLWAGALARDGYGKFKPTKATFALPHRLAYEFKIGSIPAGLEIDHLCGVRSCVNPDHLEVVTRAENIARSQGPSAVNARKTHCKRGHAFDERNTYVWAGGRTCRTCNAIHVRAYNERKKVA